ncbi:MAG: hypothetical protein ACE5HX_18055 [bacterium]
MSQIEKNYSTVALLNKHKTSSYNFEDELKKYEIAKEHFMKLLPELLKSHEGKFVVVVNGNLEIDEDEGELLDRVTEKYGDISMYLSKILHERKAIKLKIRPKVILP